ncbi:MAG TPA: S1/P1 nuclease [Candidatus Acidoferrales bacterium]|nr:S1/P1 nuclease [Candidatus Acidoferrales bacterium]
MKRALLVLCVVAVCAGPGIPRAKAWGCKGHQTVAYLAEKHLTPEAKQFIVKLLTDNPIDPSLKRYCGNALSDVMADAATWADDYRDLDKTVNKEHPTAEWHYIDIPLNAPAGEVEQFCTPTGCVTQAITQQLAVLKDKNASATQRANAARFLIHFVGDIHQPLHSSDNKDRGGNCVPLKYLRRNPHLYHGSYSPNLHHIWDTEMVEADMQGADPEEFAGTLDGEFAASVEDWQKGGVQVDEWAQEGHQYAIDTAYGAFAVKIPVQTGSPTCTAVEKKLLNKHITASAAYVDAATPVVEERLAQAGVRLAMVLNEAAKAN